MRIEHLPEDNAARISPIVSRNRGIELLKQFNREEFHIQHAETVEATMRYFALILGYTQEQEF